MCLFRKFFVSLSAAALAISAGHAADLVIAMPNWPSGQVTANILKIGIKRSTASTRT
jgi:glycine betaine/proline transport system substrate-binding protein